MRKISVQNIAIILATLMLWGGAAVAQTLEQAPLNPAFTQWLQDAKKVGENEISAYIPSPVDRSHLYKKAGETPETKAPASYSLRSQGELTPVKDQVVSGPCWAFAAYASLESALLKQLSETWDFSENHLKNYHGFDNGPLDGGNADMALAYLARWDGPVRESDDPYNPSDDRPSPGGPQQKILTEALLLTDRADIKDAIMTYGAVASSMYYDAAHYNSVQNTYYYSGASQSNHGIALVGWDDAKVVSSAPGAGAWLVKNSWGTGFGDGGYFYISYYDTVAGKDGRVFNTAVATDAYAQVYQYDPLGPTGSYGYGNTTAWGANVFTATADEELLAVATHFLSPGSSYEIYIYDNFNGSTFSTQLTTVSGTVSYAGYHTISLPTPVTLQNGDDFGVVIKYTTPGETFPVPTESRVPGYTSAASAAAGQSFLSSDGIYFSDLASQSGQPNVCIKALTGASTPPSPVVQFEQDAYSVQEASTTTAINVVIAPSPETGESVVVSYAAEAISSTAGADFTMTSGTLIFASGDTQKTFAVTLLDDWLLEGDETLRLTLTLDSGDATLGAHNPVLLTIVDDEVDSDGDQIPDAIEETLGSNPNQADTDHDGINDFDEVTNFGAENWTEWNAIDGYAAVVYNPITNPGGVFTDVLNADTDGDSVSDGAERTFGTSPINPADVPELPVLNHLALLGILLTLITGTVWRLHKQRTTA